MNTDDKITNDKYIQIYNIVGIIGSVIWAGTIFLRETNAVQIPWLNFILGIAPNFGAVFLYSGLTVIFWKYTFKNDFVPEKMNCLLAVILLLLLLSEIIHHYLLNSTFDFWDMAVSILAAVIVYLFNRTFIKKNSR